MTAPDAPALSITATTATSITVAWTTPDDNGTPLHPTDAYDLYLLPSYTGAFALGTNTHTFTGLTTGASYTVMIQARNTLNQTSSPDYITGTAADVEIAPAGRGINVVTCGGEFFIDDETLHRRAFCITQDLTPLWMYGARRGTNLVIPEVTGQLARRLRYDQAEHSLEMLVVGSVLYDDSLATDPWEGLATNVDWLEDNLLSPSTANDSTRDGKLVLPSGANRTGKIQVVNFVRGEIVEGYEMNGARSVGFRATLDIRIPAGRLVGTG